MKERIRLGVMGLARGIYFLKIAKLLKEDLVVVSVCENRPEAVEKAREHFVEETKLYEDFDEFLHSGIDAVVLCNYYHEHAKYAIKAFEAGVAVLSETTAAPSLGECVDLVEAVERTGGKYMLAANCPYFKAVHAMKERLENKTYGELVYADAEYIHPATKKLPDLDVNNLHWRQSLPATYYNMHTLGPLMYITGSVPVKVAAKCAISEVKYSLANSVRACVLTEMSNGAVFHTTGHVGVGTKSKWYRLACTGGTMETKRYDEPEEYLLEAGPEDPQPTETLQSWSSCGVLTQEEEQKFADVIEQAGHGGIDLVMMIHFVKFVRGEEEAFFDVYRSVALSAAGILAWYSVLEGSREMTIPDFSKKEERDRVRGDYRSPFAKKENEITLPYRV